MALYDKKFHALIRKPLFQFPDFIFDNIQGFFPDISDENEKMVNDVVASPVNRLR